jgi:hypothetical protein
MYIKCDETRDDALVARNVENAVRSFLVFISRARSPTRPYADYRRSIHSDASIISDNNSNIFARQSDRVVRVDRTVLANEFRLEGYLLLLLQVSHVRITLSRIANLNPLCVMRLGIGEYGLSLSTNHQTRSNYLGSSLGEIVPRYRTINYMTRANLRSRTWKD